MSDNQTPKITRIDMIEWNEGVTVKKYYDGWTASTLPADVSTNATMPLAEMVAWLKGHGWTVHEWPKGARAWLGKPLPVRNTNAILSMRRRLEQETFANQGRHPRGIQVHAMDLAFDL